MGRLSSGSQATATSINGTIDIAAAAVPMRLFQPFATDLARIRIGLLKEMVPLGGLEPPHLAPEASALSTELQGQQWFNIATCDHKFQVFTSIDH